ncbi:TPA: cell division protein FtsA [bacterium]|nr:cell division protein FtsA [bacterium]
MGVKLLPKEDIVVGLDIGTSKIAAIIAEVDENNQIEVLGVGLSPSKGLRKGMIVNLETTTSAIKRAIENAELVSGLDVKSVFAGIAGEHIRAFNNNGIIIIPNKRNRQISKDDVRRVIDQAKNIEIPSDRKILDAIPREFIVDDQEAVDDPIGMFGTRLEAFVHIITGSVSAVQNIIKAIENAGLHVNDIMLQPLASSEAVLYPDEKEMGVILIDIGAGTTDVVIYVEGSIWYTAVIPIGGDFVTNDIAVGLHTPISKAEELKKTFGCALTDIVGPNELIEVPGVGGRNPKTIPRRILASVIEPRVTELLNFVNQQVKSSRYKNLTPAGVVMTGGGAMLDSIDELAERIFNTQVRIGYPREVKGLFDRVKDPSFSTCIGLVLEGVERKESGYGINSGQASLILKKMKNWFTDYFG